MGPRQGHGSHQAGLAIAGRLRRDAGRLAQHRPPPFGADQQPGAESLAVIQVETSTVSGHLRPRHLGRAHDRDAGPVQGCQQGGQDPGVLDDPAQGLPGFGLPQVRGRYGQPDGKGWAGPGPGRATVGHHDPLHGLGRRLQPVVEAQVAPLSQGGEGNGRGAPVKGLRLHRLRPVGVHQGHGKAGLVQGQGQGRPGQAAACNGDIKVGLDVHAPNLALPARQVQITARHNWRQVSAGGVW